MPGIYPGTRAKVRDAMMAFYIQKFAGPNRGRIETIVLQALAKRIFERLLSWIIHKCRPQLWAIAQGKYLKNDPRIYPRGSA